MNRLKLLKKLLTGSANTPFRDLRAAAEAFGFRLDRVTGGHHIYVHDGVKKVLNLQGRKGKAKPYQIRQLLRIIEDFDLLSEADA